MDDTRYRIIEELRPGILADLVRLHMDYYGPEWGLGEQFETGLVDGFGEFENRFDPARDYFAYARNRHGNVVGMIAMDGVDRDGRGGRLRWFIVDPKTGRAGIGRALIERALTFADRSGMSKVWLSTFPGLQAARHLYEAHGFELAEEHTEDHWGGSNGEQIFVRRRSTPSLTQNGPPQGRPA